MNDESARNASRLRMNACVQPRFARAIRLYLVGEREKGRILFEQTSYTYAINIIVDPTFIEFICNNNSCICWPISFMKQSLLVGRTPFGKESQLLKR